MTPLEIVIAVSLVILTIVLTAVGVQLFLTLLDVRKTLVRINDTLDDASNTVAGFVQPLQQIGTAMLTVRSSLKIFDAFTGWLNRNDKRE